MIKNNGKHEYFCMQIAGTAYPLITWIVANKINFNKKLHFLCISTNSNNSASKMWLTYDLLDVVLFCSSMILKKVDWLHHHGE